MPAQSWPTAVLCLPPLQPKAVNSVGLAIVICPTSTKVTKASPRLQSWASHNSSFISWDPQWSLFLSWNHLKHLPPSSSKPLLRTYLCCHEGLLSHPVSVAQQSQQPRQMGAALGGWMLCPFSPPPKLKTFELGIPKLESSLNLSDT